MKIIVNYGMNGVNKMKVPASFANQFYGLRGDIGFVRDRLTNTPPADRR